MNRKLKGSLLLLLSASIYGLYGSVARFVGIGFGAFSQSWVRNLIILFFLSIIFLTKKEKWVRVEKKDIKWFLIWILPSSIQPVLTFIAFNHLQLGTAYYLLYSTMIIGGLVSGKIFFSEKLNLNKYFSIILVFTGLFLIYGSDIKLAGNIYVILMLLSGFLVGLWNVLTKKISGKYSEFQMMAMDSMASLIICFLISVVIGEKLPGFKNINSWLWVFVFSLLAMCTTFVLIKGFKYVEAQVGSLVLPTEVFFASIFGFLIFREILSLNVYLGGILIFFAATFPEMISYIRNKSNILF